MARRSGSDARQATNGAAYGRRAVCCLSRGDVRIALGALTLAVALAAGCAGPSLGPPTPYPHAPPGETAIPVGMAQMPWPPSLMTHRAILSIGGSELPLDGRLAVGEGGALRLVVLGPMGQVVFDVLAEPGREPRLVRVAPAFPEEWVRTRVARDLQAVFRTPPAGGRIEGGGTELRCFAAAGAADGPTRWSRIEGVREGACVYRVAALEPRQFAGLDRPVPARVRIEAVGYTLDIRIVDLKPGAPPERLFRGE